MPALSLRHGFTAATMAAALALVSPKLSAQPDFGDNTSRWADDGECDDPRFSGDGAADTLLEEDRGHDAADCRELFEAGRIALRSSAPPRRDPLDFGDDHSEWARDGECDDPRFTGDGMAAMLVDGDAYHDATDCRALVEQGRIALRTETENALKWRGRLESGDDTLTTGEHFDSYEFEGSPGEQVSIDLRSAEFDTYLILQDPAGEQIENDDAEDGDDPGHSRIEAELTEGGTYHVLVTSYESGETGAYALTIDGALAR